ncbi:MAG: pyridoxal-phosphate dependent enzyme [Pseudomonadota bacterium]
MRCARTTDETLAGLFDRLSEVPLPSVDVARPAALLMRCPATGETPLHNVPALAERAGVSAVHIKDERNRMGLGSFKALGAAYVIACDAQKGGAAGRTYVTASAGNHGLSVAAGAQAFGARAVVYLAETVPAGFADRLRSFGAELRFEGAVYEDSMAAAAAAADTNGWKLLSDSSWDGYFETPWRLMEGYLVLMEETVRQMPEPPTHIFLQAGVGGLAAASAAYARHAWGHNPRIIVVEPEAARPIFASAEAGQMQTVKGPSSSMGRLDCKEASMIALRGLARDADAFIAITEKEGATGDEVMRALGFASTPSGAAGVAGLLAAQGQLGLGHTARVLAVLSEGPEDVG